MGKTGNGRNGKATSARRRAEVRRALPKQALDLRALLARGDLLSSLLILVCLVVGIGTFLGWTREQVKVRDGQVMTDTRLKRLDYLVEDSAATQRNQEAARLASPRIYRVNTAHLKRLEAALQGLPRAVADKSTLDEISQELIQEFQLTNDGLLLLQGFVDADEPTPQWTRWVASLLDDHLIRRPLLTSQEYQVFTTTANTALGDRREAISGQPIELRTDGRAETAARLREVVTAAGFPADVAPFIAWRLVWDGQPTFVHDQAETESAATAAASTVAPVFIEHKRGQVLYKRGDQLTPSQYEQTLTEVFHFSTEAPLADRWLPRLGVAGLAAVLIMFLALHIGRTYPRVVTKPLRAAGLGVLSLGMLVLSGTIAVHAPNLLIPASVAPTLLVAIVVLLAYDVRLALFVSGLQCVLVVLAMEHGIGWFILLFAGCGAMVAMLRDLRHRNTLIRAAAASAIVLAAGSLLLGFYETPLVPGAAAQVMWNAVWAATASFAVGFLVLGVLPSIEKLFDITTGMTLAELRDPKQPLLRQLQQKAPGTYNHSLQVANVAEAAADAIGADSLLVYVGALYHDIGKMNKPEYFVENQAGGVNKHDKLSPAMSLLVIIGHVKDGVELAREFNLPRSILHFIESHHGTTLVEYFYRAAQTRAKQDDRSAVVAEVEFRYPGPKPRTKEAAIMMISDAVESATRAMAEPTPGRIESLVRDLSRKRLMDGQFNQCDLTFRELGLIEDAIINRLCAVYHSRISYPSDRPEKLEETTAEEATMEAKAISA